MKPSSILPAAFALVAFASSVEAGPIAYGICQAGCAGIVVACYAAAGFTYADALLSSPYTPAYPDARSSDDQRPIFPYSFGTVTAGAGTPAAIIACNGAFGSCQAACAAIALAPTP